MTQTANFVSNVKNVKEGFHGFANFCSDLAFGRGCLCLKMSVKRKPSALDGLARWFSGPKVLIFGWKNFIIAV
jgi:hypothetical protein